MMRTVTGVYRNGHIQLSETPENVASEAPVLVTFLGSGVIDLRQRGISEGQAAEIRGALAAFAEDWDSPEMAEYDNYDQHRGDLEAR
jgi:hypothetical protein